MKRISLFLIIIAIVIVTFTGCGRNVKGEIRNALTSELIEEAVVLYFDNEPMIIEGGQFVLRKIEEGPHTLRVEHTGFIKYDKTMTLKADSKIVIALISNSAPATHTSWQNKDIQQVFGIQIHDNQLYVASSIKVLRYTLDGTYIDDFATGLSSPCPFIAFDGAGNLWAVDNADKVHRFDSSGAVARTYEGLLNGNTNWGLALDQTYIYISDSVANKIRKYTQADGSFVKEIGAAEGLAFNEVTQIAFGPDGNLYVADFMNGRIVVLSKALSVQRTFSTMADDETHSYPLALAFGPDDCLYVHDRANDCIKKIAPDDSIIQKIPTPSMFVNGLAFNDSGTLYVSDNSWADPCIHAYSWSAE